MLQSGTGALQQQNARLKPVNAAMLQLTGKLGLAGRCMTTLRITIDTRQTGRPFVHLTWYNQRQRLMLA